MPAFEAFQKLGLNIVNGWPAVSRARVVKTRDEIELLKHGVEHRRRGDVEDQVRVAQAGRPRARDRSEGARVHARARLRDHLRHHRRLGRQHQPVPPLGDRQAHSPGRPRHRRHQRGRPLRLLHRLRALLQVRRPVRREDDRQGDRPLPRGLRLDVRRHRAAQAGQHDRRRRQAVPGVRRRQVRDGDAAAVRAQHRHHAVRGHVDVARLLDEVPGGDQGEHVLRDRDVRRAPVSRADLPPRGERARQRRRSRRSSRAWSTWKRRWPSDGSSDGIPGSRRRFRLPEPRPGHGGRVEDRRPICSWPRSRRPRRS